MLNKYNVVVGIDLSLSGTALYEISAPFLNVIKPGYVKLRHNFIQFTGKKTYPKLDKRLVYLDQSLFTEQRIDAIVDFIENRYLALGKKALFVIESQSFFSQFRTNLEWDSIYGCLKKKLRENNWDYIECTPTHLKKFATGKGNAKKDQMLVQFKKDKIYDYLNLEDIPQPKSCNPVENVCDAYYLSKYGVEYILSGAKIMITLGDKIRYLQRADLCQAIKDIYDNQPRNLLRKLDGDEFNLLTKEEIRETLQKELKNTNRWTVKKSLEIALGWMDGRKFQWWLKPRKAK